MAWAGHVTTLILWQPHERNMATEGMGGRYAEMAWGRTLYTYREQWSALSVERVWPAWSSVTLSNYFYNYLDLLLMKIL